MDEAASSVAMLSPYIVDDKVAEVRDVDAKRKVQQKEKKRFLLFTRVLMKYLEARDLNVYIKARAQIKECYEKNKFGDPNYQSLTASMKAQLRQTVGEAHWKKAQEYLDRFLKHMNQTKEEKQKQSTALALTAELSQGGQVKHRGSTELAALIAELSQCRQVHRGLAVRGRGNPLTHIAHTEYEKFVVRLSNDAMSKASSEDLCTRSYSESNQSIPLTPGSNGTSEAVYSSPRPPPIPSIVGGSNFIIIRDVFRNW